MRTKVEIVKETEKAIIVNLNVNIYNHDVTLLNKTLPKSRIQIISDTEVEVEDWLIKQECYFALSKANCTMNCEYVSQDKMNAYNRKAQMGSSMRK